MPRYVQISVDSAVRWPPAETEVVFGDRVIKLIPSRRDDVGRLTAYPMAAVEYARGEYEPDLVGLIRRFLNGLAWRDQAYIREVQVVYGAPLRDGTRVSDNFTDPHFDVSRLPDPLDDKARMALAFYREGLALEHIHLAYSFLSFFKVLNINLSNSRQQIDWINATAKDLDWKGDKERVREVGITAPDIGSYLYGSGRCAVAHAFSNPVVDPDNIHDQRRLAADLSIIRRLAAAFIQREWGIGAPPPHHSV